MAIETKPEVTVVVVDDSAFMRKAITMMLESDPTIKVIGTARDGEEGVEKVRRLKPDLVTMDIEMPRMDGLTALRADHVHQSGAGDDDFIDYHRGAQATLDALELGAVDFIPKQMSFVSLDIVKIKDELLQKIKHIVKRKSILMARYRTRAGFRAVTGQQAPGATAKSLIRPSDKPVESAKALIKRHHNVNLIAIGSSTGGPPALQSVIPALPRSLPVGIVIAQHMPPMFTKSLAERLDQLSQVTVREAVNGESIEPGTVLIAPGGMHLTVVRRSGRLTAVVNAEPVGTLYHPCVDVLFNSVAETVGGAALGVSSHRYGQQRHARCPTPEGKRCHCDRAKRGNLRGLRHAQVSDRSSTGRPCRGNRSNRVRSGQLLLIPKVFVEFSPEIEQNFPMLEMQVWV